VLRKNDRIEIIPAERRFKIRRLKIPPRPPDIDIFFIWSGEGMIERQNETNKKQICTCCSKIPKILYFCRKVLVITVKSRWGIQNWINFHQYWILSGRGPLLLELRKSTYVNNFSLVHFLSCVLYKLIHFDVNSILFWSYRFLVSAITTMGR